MNDRYQESWDDYFAAEDSIRERYWAELLDVKREAEISRDEDAYQAMERWNALSVGARIGAVIEDAVLYAVKMFVWDMQIPAEDDIPF